MERMVKIIKKITGKLGFEIIRYFPNSTTIKKEFVSLKPKNVCKGNVLLSYRGVKSAGVDAFFVFQLKDGEPIPNSHTNYWESL